MRTPDSAPLLQLPLGNYFRRAPLGFLEDCAAKQWPFGQQIPPRSLRKNLTDHYEKFVRISPEDHRVIKGSEPRTPNPALRTSNSPLRTPHSELRTPHSELRTPNSELPTPNALALVINA